MSKQTLKEELLVDVDGVKRVAADIKKHADKGVKFKRMKELEEIHDTLGSLSKMAKSEEDKKELMKGLFFLGGSYELVNRAMNQSEILFNLVQDMEKIVDKSEVKKHVDLSVLYNKNIDLTIYSSFSQDSQEWVEMLETAQKRVKQIIKVLSNSENRFKTISKLAKELQKENKQENQDKIVSEILKVMSEENENRKDMGPTFQSTKNITGMFYQYLSVGKYAKQTMKEEVEDASIELMDLMRPYIEKATKKYGGTFFRSEAFKTSTTKPSIGFNLVYDNIDTDVDKNKAVVYFRCYPSRSKPDGVVIDMTKLDKNKKSTETNENDMFVASMSKLSSITLGIENFLKKITTKNEQKKNNRTED